MRAPRHSPGIRRCLLPPGWRLAGSPRCRLRRRGGPRSWAVLPELFMSPPRHGPGAGSPCSGLAGRLHPDASAAPGAAPASPDADAGPAATIVTSPGGGGGARYRGAGRPRWCPHLGQPGRRAPHRPRRGGPLRRRISSSLLVCERDRAFCRQRLRCSGDRRACRFRVAHPAPGCGPRWDGLPLAADPRRRGGGLLGLRVSMTDIQSRKEAEYQLLETVPPSAPRPCPSTICAAATRSACAVGAARRGAGGHPVHGPGPPVVYCNQAFYEIWGAIQQEPGRRARRDAAAAW